MNPQRIIAAPYSVWLAPQGTLFPPLSASEAVIKGQKYKNQLPSTSGNEYTWFRLGTAGTKDYSEAGVTITHQQTIQSFQGAGSTWTRKAWRSDEGMTVAFDLADLTPAQYAQIMDELTVFNTSGFGLSSGAEVRNEGFVLNRGLNVRGYSMFLRGFSSLGETVTPGEGQTAANKVSQYEVTYCYQAGNPAPKFAIKGGPALLSCTFTVIEGDSALEVTSAAEEKEVQEGKKPGVYPKLRVGY